MACSVALGLLSDVVIMGDITDNALLWVYLVGRVLRSIS